ATLNCSVSASPSTCPTRRSSDLGIHSKGWSREQAIQSMMQATGNDETSTITEIERYCVIPGQACSYMVGRQAILRMRASAQQALDRKSTRLNSSHVKISYAVFCL